MAADRVGQAPLSPREAEWIRGFATALESVLDISHDEQAARFACRAAGLRLIDFARADVNPPTLAKLEAILSPDRDVTTAPNGGDHG